MELSSVAFKKRDVFKCYCYAYFVRSDMNQLKSNVSTKSKVTVSMFNFYYVIFSLIQNEELRKKKTS